MKLVVPSMLPAAMTSSVKPFPIFFANSGVLDFLRVFDIVEDNQGGSREVFELPAHSAVPPHRQYAHTVRGVEQRRTPVGVPF